MRKLSALSIHAVVFSSCLRKRRKNDGLDKTNETGVARMGNDKLEILSCRIPALSTHFAVRRVQRLAEYPLARASEWSPLPAGAISFDNGDEAEDLQE